MFLLGLFVFFAWIYAELQAISTVYSLLAAQSSGPLAFILVGISFFVMATFGGTLIRLQSQSLLRKLKQVGASSSLPKPNVLVFLAGVLFLIPGYVSDLAALFLLFPPTAWVVQRIFKNRLKKFAEKGGVRFYGTFGGQAASRNPWPQRPSGPGQITSDPNVIDVEVTRS